MNPIYVPSNNNNRDIKNPYIKILISIIYEKMMDIIPDMIINLDDKDIKDVDNIESILDTVCNLFNHAGWTAKWNRGGHSKGLYLNIAYVKGTPQNTRVMYEEVTILTYDQVIALQSYEIADVNAAIQSINRLLEREYRGKKDKESVGISEHEMPSMRKRIKWLVMNEFEKNYHIRYMPDIRDSVYFFTQK